MSKNLFKSSLIFSCMTFLSRILGFVRDVIAASVFGAGPGYDAFVLAFRIPNLMRRLFAEGAFSQAFVPVLSEYQEQRSQEEVKAFVDNITGNLALVLLVVTVIGVLAAPGFVYIFAPGFDVAGPRYELAVSMLRVTFPYTFFICLTALAGSLLNTRGKFGVPAFTPIFLNICLILASCGLAMRMEHPEMALAWGVFIAGVVQLGFQIPFLWRVGALPRPRVNWADPAVRRVLWLMPPAIFGAAISQITLMVDSWFASFLVSGSISWLYYADRLMEFPLGIIGVGLATVILPSLSRHHAANAQQKFAQTLDWGIRCVLLIGTPAMLGLFVLAGPLVETLFRFGKFTTFDVDMTQQCLMGYALAVLGIMLAKIFSSAFYATQNIKTPVKISSFILVINVILNALLIRIFAHVGLALATSITSLLNATILYLTWRKMHAFRFQPGWYSLLLRLVVANGILAGFLYLCSPGLEVWTTWSTVAKAIRLAQLVGGGGLLYASVLLASGMRFRQLLAPA